MSDLIAAVKRVAENIAVTSQKEYQGEKTADLLALEIAIATLSAPQPAPVAAEPIATLHDDGHYTWNKGKEIYDSRHAGWRMQVYASPLPAQAPDPFSDEFSEEAFNEIAESAQKLSFALGGGEIDGDESGAYLVCRFLDEIAECVTDAGIKWNHEDGSLHIPGLPAQQGDVADEETFERLMDALCIDVLENVMKPPGTHPVKAREALRAFFKQTRPSAPAQAVPGGVGPNDTGEFQVLPGAHSAQLAIASADKTVQFTLSKQSVPNLIFALQSALSTQAGSEA